MNDLPPPIDRPQQGPAPERSQRLAVVGTGLMARCCQHETDHLDGILFLDRLDAQARKAAMKEIRQAPWYDAANPPTVKISPHGSVR